MPLKIDKTVDTETNLFIIDLYFYIMRWQCNSNREGSMIPKAYYLTMLDL